MIFEVVTSTGLRAEADTKAEAFKIAERFEKMAGEWPTIVARPSK